MADKSKINWTDATLNFVTGCTKISSGCKNCYSAKMTKRLNAMGVEKYKEGFDKVVCHDDPGLFLAPQKWRKSRSVFVNSMSDTFHDDVPFSFVYKIYECMSRSEKHVFQVLTKRPGRMKEFLRIYYYCSNASSILTNIYHGVTVESRDEADRIDVLRSSHCRNKFVSFEPLIGEPFAPDLKGIDSVIIGGESGPGAREINLKSARLIIDAALKEGCRIFFKQMGSVWAKKNKSLSRKGDIVEEWPQWARVRSLPWILEQGGRDG